MFCSVLVVKRMFGCKGVKIGKNIFYACVVRIKDEVNIVDITEIAYDQLFFVGCAMCTASMYGKIPDKIPEEGAP
jgi:hypothetical protein